MKITEWFKKDKPTDQVEMLTELLELSIKAGRRMFHDYKHMLSEISQECVFLDDFKKRGEIWESIFYPDKGMKNYRADMHREMDKLRYTIEKQRKQLEENGIVDVSEL